MIWITFPFSPAELVIFLLQTEFTAVNEDGTESTGVLIVQYVSSGSFIPLSINKCQNAQSNNVAPPPASCCCLSSAAVQEIKL